MVFVIREANLKVFSKSDILFHEENYVLLDLAQVRKRLLQNLFGHMK